MSPSIPGMPASNPPPGPKLPPINLYRKVNFLRVVIYIVLACLVIETAALISLSTLDTEIETPFDFLRPTLRAAKASLYLAPNVGHYKVGDEFDVDVFVNTRDQQVVVTAAYLSYNTDDLTAESIDLSDSDFDFIAEKLIDKNEGKIKITVGKPTPGVNSERGKIGTVKFRALQTAAPSKYNVNFDFTKNSSNFSTVILDDKKGTNILSSVQGANIFIDD